VWLIERKRGREREREREKETEKEIELHGVSSGDARYDTRKVYIRISALLAEVEKVQGRKEATEGR